MLLNDLMNQAWEQGMLQEGWYLCEFQIPAPTEEEASQMSEEELLQLKNRIEFLTAIRTEAVREAAQENPCVRVQQLVGNKVRIYYKPPQ